VTDLVSTSARLLFPRLAGLYAVGERASYAVLRAGFGLVILTHGVPKLLRIPHGSMTDPFAGATRLIETSLGLPFAPQLALLITGLETVGALALALGLFTRLLAPMFAVQMLVICIALRANFAWIDRGWEFPLVLGLIALFIAFRGGGEWSLDRLLKREL
jgi:putative oxidoreductase